MIGLNSFGVLAEFILGLAPGRPFAEPGLIGCIPGFSAFQNSRPTSILDPDLSVKLAVGNANIHDLRLAQAVVVGFAKSKVELKKRGNGGSAEG